VMVRMVYLDGMGSRHGRKYSAMVEWAPRSFLLYPCDAMVVGFG
jgi:hypothetical protein